MTGNGPSPSSVPANAALVKSIERGFPVLDGYPACNMIKLSEYADSSCVWEWMNHTVGYMVMPQAKMTQGENVTNLTEEETNSQMRDMLHRMQKFTVVTSIPWSWIRQFLENLHLEVFPELRVVYIETFIDEAVWDEPVIWFLPGGHSQPGLRWPVKYELEERIAGVPDDDGNTPVILHGLYKFVPYVPDYSWMSQCGPR